MKSSAIFLASNSINGQKFVNFPLLAEKHIVPLIAAYSSIVTFRDRKETTLELCIVNLRVVQFAFKLGYLLW
jgi:hypothetical protein